MTLLTPDNHRVEVYTDSSDLVRAKVTHLPSGYSVTVRNRSRYLAKERAMQKLEDMLRERMEKRV